MLARVIWAKGSPDLSDMWVKLVNETLIPAARTQDGYRGYIAIYDPDRGLTMAVTLWRDAETESASDLAARVGREEMARAVGAEIRVERYEVAAAEVVP